MSGPTSKQRAMDARSTKVLYAQVSTDEARRIKAVADGLEITVAAFIRYALSCYLVSDGRQPLEIIEKPRGPRRV